MIQTTSERPHKRYYVLEMRGKVRRGRKEEMSNIGRQGVNAQPEMRQDAAQARVVRKRKLR